MAYASSYCDLWGFILFIHENYININFYMAFINYANIKGEIMKIFLCALVLLSIPMTQAMADTIYFQLLDPACAKKASPKPIPVPSGTYTIKIDKECNATVTAGPPKEQ
jgi:hypothetical protein